MKLKNIFKKLFNRKRRKRARRYNAAIISRLTASLASNTDFINNTLRYELRILRARSRELAQNNPFVKRFISLVVTNVCGPVPFKLQAKAKNKSGNLEKNANRLIESVWKEWSKPDNCDITARHSWAALQRLIVRTLAIDGEVLIRKYKGTSYGRYSYQLQLIDMDRLDETKNESLSNGGAIHMGVEVNSVNKPVAYHILKRKPAAWVTNYDYTREYERIPANEIIHLYMSDFVEQVRGVPWIYAALLNLANIGGFEESMIIAARVGAAQMGFIESPDGGDLFDYDTEDSEGHPTIDAEPGIFPVLPPGYKTSGWNPKYPDAAVEPFLKACLRGVAAGVDVAYHNLSGDMEGVNYSSARIAELNERDGWMTIQSFVSEHLHQRIYDDWLAVQILTNMLQLNPSAIEKYKNIKWQGRRWAWVDPLKEVKAKVVAINNNLESRTKVIAEKGEDIDDVFAELEQENAKLPNDPKEAMTSNDDDDDEDVEEDKKSYA